LTASAILRASSISEFTMVTCPIFLKGRVIFYQICGVTPVQPKIFSMFSLHFQ
jgi:hypothetical protein